MGVDGMHTPAKLFRDLLTTQPLLYEFYDLKFGICKYTSCHKEFVTAVKMKTLMHFLNL